MKKFAILFLIAHCSLQIARADWVNVTNEITNLNINALTSTGNYIFAGNNQYVYRSSNNGDNWQVVYNLSALALASNGNYVYMGYEGGVGRSTDYGNNWGYAGLNQWTLCLLTNGNHVYAGCFWPIPGGGTNRGVWISSNYGANWTQTALNNINIYALAVSGSYLFATGYNSGVGSGIFVSTDNGQSWSNPHIVSGNALAANGNIIYQGSQGVYKSTNYGSNWLQTTLNSGSVYALLTYLNNVFAGGYISGGGFWVSIDSGATWMNKSEGIINGVRAMNVTGGYIFVGTDGAGVYRRPLSELLGIKPITNKVPNNSALQQNYPNPFNAATIINYELKITSYVRLAIYDIFAKEVTILVNEKQRPGSYNIEFEGSNLASGTYFCRLIADGRIIGSKKMILTK